MTSLNDWVGALTDVGDLPVGMESLPHVRITPRSDGGGWCVKARSDGAYCIDVFRMMVNYRIVLSPVSPAPHQTYTHGWCYFGHGYTSTGEPRTMRTAAAWDGYGAPIGYDNSAM